MFFAGLYYKLKPFIPRIAQIKLRRLLVKRKRKICADIWPIDQRAAVPPANWPGWPEQKRFALVLTHDVDTAKGQANCYDLMELEKEQGFQSSFNFVPERYEVSLDLRHHLTANGFEVGVHGLCHDGNLYKSKEIFLTRAVQINKYLKEWGAVGFRSPAMHHNLKWIHNLDIEYDASTFDTDPFEPQPDGVTTIFPFWVQCDSRNTGYVELPYTLPQDFTPLILMGEKTIDIWIQKLDWIVEHGGMALINIHPDYMNFAGEKLGLEEYPAEMYTNFLKYVAERYAGQYWHVLPREMAHYIKKMNTQLSGLS